MTPGVQMGCTFLISRKVGEQQAPAAPKKDVDVLDVWYGRLAHADCHSVQWMAEKDVERDNSRRQRSGLDECSQCIEGAMTDTPMPSRTHVEVRPGAVIRTDVSVMNVPSIGRARYFVTSIDEVSSYVKVFHMKWKGEAAELLKCQFCWVEGPSGCMVKKIVLDGGNEHAKGSEDLEIQGIEVPPNPSFTP